MCDTHWTAQSIIKCIEHFWNPQPSMTHVCASVSLSVLLILRAFHLFFLYTHWLFQSCFDVCKCCSAEKPLKCTHPWSSEGTYPVMTPFTVTSEILYHRTNHDTHLLTYSAVTGFSSSSSHSDWQVRHSSRWSLQSNHQWVKYSHRGWMCNLLCVIENLSSDQLLSDDR